MSTGKITLHRPAGGSGAGSVVVEIDRGLDALTKEASTWGLLAAFVGVRQEAGSEVATGDSLNLAQIAAVNEFGSSNGHVPERSFLRSTIDDNRDSYAKGLDRAVNAGIDTVVAGGIGTPAVIRSLQLLGQEVSGDVQGKIRDLRDPPNAPRTIAAKGSSNPLIDTGRLRASIDSEVRMGRRAAARKVG